MVIEHCFCTEILSEFLGNITDKFPVDKGEKAEDILSTLIYSYYDNKPIVAREILTTVPLPDKEVLSLALSQKAKVKITISTPKIGTRKELADMADKNAQTSLKAPLLTSDVIARCGLRFAYAAENKEEVNGFLTALIAVNNKAAKMPAEAFFWTETRD